MKNLKIRKFGNGKISRMLENYNGVCFDESYPLTKQLLGVFMKNDKTNLAFKSFDRYVKIFENINMPTPQSENIIKRRLSIKTSLGKKRNRANK